MRSELFESNQHWYFTSLPRAKNDCGIWLGSSQVTQIDFPFLSTYFPSQSHQLCMIWSKERTRLNITPNTTHRKRQKTQNVTPRYACHYFNRFTQHLHNSHFLRQDAQGRAFNSLRNVYSRISFLLFTPSALQGWFCTPVWLIVPDSYRAVPNASTRTAENTCAEHTPTHPPTRPRGFSGQRRVSDLWRTGLRFMDERINYGENVLLVLLEADESLLCINIRFIRLGLIFSLIRTGFVSHEEGKWCTY